MEPPGPSARASFHLNLRVRRSAEEMLQPPIKGAGVGFWFHAKIMEMAAHILTEPSGELLPDGTSARSSSGSSG